MRKLKTQLCALAADKLAEIFLQRACAQSPCRSAPEGMVSRAILFHILYEFVCSICHFAPCSATPLLERNNPRAGPRSILSIGGA